MTGSWTSLTSALIPTPSEQTHSADHERPPDVRVGSTVSTVARELGNLHERSEQKLAIENGKNPSGPFPRRDQEVDSVDGTGTAVRPATLLDLLKVSRCIMTPSVTPTSKHNIELHVMISVSAMGWEPSNWELDSAGRVINEACVLAPGIDSKAYRRSTARPSRPWVNGGGSCAE
jgi:hypothetical protein